MFLIFPYRIERPFRMPWATIGIMAACILMLVVQVMLGVEDSIGIVGYRPNAFGAITWLTAMFAHGGIMHLAGNMYFLWVFGGVLEDAIGRPRYLALYFAGGIVATLTHTVMMLAFSPNEATIPVVGASGAIAAIMGVAAVRFYKLKMRVWYFIFFGFLIRGGTFGVTASLGLALYFLNELASGLWGLSGSADGVAYWAHIGGMAFGAVVAYAFGLGKALVTEEKRQEADTWIAMGRHDIASSTLAQAPVSDAIEVLLTSVRGSLHRSVPDVAGARSSASQAANELVRLGRRDEARDVYREFSPFSSTQAVFDAPALASVASGCEAIGDLDAAACAYYDVLRLHPASAESEKALYRLAHVYLAQGRTPEAHQTWSAFLQHFPASQWRGYADDRLSAATA